MNCIYFILRNIVCFWLIGKLFVENIKLFFVKFYLFFYFDKIKVRCDIEVVRFNLVIEVC